MKFRTKPCEIEAVQWTGRNVAEIMRFVKNESAIITNGCIDNKNLRGRYGSKHQVTTSSEDYDGEYYPCKPDVFQKKYEPCESKR